MSFTIVTSENERHAIFDGPTIQRCCNPSWTIAGGCRSLNSGIFDSRGWSPSATVESTDFFTHVESALIL